MVARSGRDRALGVGDLLFSRAFAELAVNGSEAEVAEMSSASVALALGELAQRHDAYDTGVSEERYLERLFGEEAAHLEAQLPGKLKDLLMRCERHIGKPANKFGREDFIRMVSEDLGVDNLQAEKRIRDVFSALRDQVSEGEIEDVIGQLPADLRDLWQRAI